MDRKPPSNGAAPQSNDRAAAKKVKANHTGTTKKPTPKKAVARKPRKSNPDRGRKYDWLTIRTAFIEGIQEEEGADPRKFLNMKELAEHFGIPVQRIRERGAEERWYDQREQYRMKMAKRRQAKRILELSEESLDFDSKSLGLAKLGMAMVTTRMSEIARDVKEHATRREEALRQQMAGYPADPEDMQTVIDARELDTLARAATGWQMLGQKALGTDVQRMEIQQDIQHNIDMDVEVTSISAELGRDDPERLSGFLMAAQRAGIIGDFLLNQGELEGSGNPEIDNAVADIVDAELLEDDEPTEGESLQF